MKEIHLLNTILSLIYGLGSIERLEAILTVETQQACPRPLGDKRYSMRKEKNLINRKQITFHLHLFAILLNVCFT